MDPITIAALAATASAGAQWLGGEQARKDQKKRNAEIEDLYSGIKIPEFSKQMYDDLLSEGYTEDQIAEMLTYAGYDYAGDVLPTLAAYQHEVGPTLIRDTADSMAGRDAIREAMSRYKNISGSGFDPELEAELAKIEDRAAMNAKSDRDSILQNFSRRGQLGTTQMMAAQMMSGQDQQAQAAAAAREAAALSYRNRLNALDKSAALGGELFDLDFKGQNTNANIINDFNARTARNYNAYSQNRADTINNINLKNRDARQGVMNSNTDVYNRQTADRYKANINERDRRDDIRYSQDDALQREFNNRMKVADGKSGRITAAGNQAIQNTRDRNQMIQGIGDAFISWSERQRQQEFDDKLLNALQNNRQ